MSSFNRAVFIEFLPLTSAFSSLLCSKHVISSPAQLADFNLELPSCTAAKGTGKLSQDHTFLPLWTIGRKYLMGVSWLFLLHKIRIQLRLSKPSRVYSLGVTVLMGSWRCVYEELDLMFRSGAGISQERYCVTWIKIPELRCWAGIWAACRTSRTKSLFLSLSWNKGNPKSCLTFFYRPALYRPRKGELIQVLWKIVIRIPHKKWRKAGPSEDPHPPGWVFHMATLDPLVTRPDPVISFVSARDYPPVA